MVKPVAENKGIFFQNLVQDAVRPQDYRPKHTHGSQGANLPLFLKTTRDSFSKEMDTESLTWFQQALRKVERR